MRTRILARAVMNGESTDPQAWMAMFPSLFGGGVLRPPIAPDPRRCWPHRSTVAERGEQVRSQFRGAIVEELTARLLARRAGPAAVRRERRILFDGVRAEIHPYDVTVERDGAAEAYDCKWGARGINADVLHQLDDARAHAAEEDERLAVGAGGVRRRSGRAMSGSRSRPPRTRRRRSSRSRRSTGSRTGRRERRDPAHRARREPDACSAPYRRALRRGRPGRAAAHLRRAALRPGPRLVPLGQPRLHRAWYAERGLAWLGARGRGARRCADVRVGDELPGHDPGRRLAPGLGASADRVRRCDRRARRVDPRRLGAPRCARCADARSRPSSSRCSGRPRRPSRSRRVAPPADRRRMSRRATFTVRPQELDPMDHVNNAVYADWLDEQVIARRGSRRRPAPCRGPSASSTPARPSRVPAWKGGPGPPMTAAGGRDSRARTGPSSSAPDSIRGDPPGPADAARRARRPAPRDRGRPRPIAGDPRRAVGRPLVGPARPRRSDRGVGHPRPGEHRFRRRGRRRDRRQHPVPRGGRTPTTATPVWTCSSTPPTRARGSVATPSGRSPATSSRHSTTTG